MGIYSKEVFIHSSYVDNSKRVRLSSYFELIQNFVCEAVTDEGFGKDITVYKGFLWIILKTYVEIYELPILEDTITLYTYPKDIKKFIYPRIVFGKSKSGKILFKMNTYWALLKEDERRLALPQETHVLSPGQSYEEYDIDIKTPKFDKPLELRDSRKVMYSDIDLNNHLNNLKYFNYCLDIHDSDFYKSRNIKSIYVQYHKEVREGETIFVYSSNTNLELFEIRDANGDKMFSLEIGYDIK